MPYRHAHWFVLVLLVPAIAMAFWRDYFGVIGSAPLAFHAHGLTASAWILLVALQSWSAHHRRFALHRASGRAVLFVVPLFAAGAALVLHSMALKFTGGHPFYGIFGARLGLHDIISTVVLVGMVRAALLNRKRVARHAAYMLGTTLLVLPPILARLPVPAPPALHLGEMLSIVIAALLWLGHRREGRAFAVVIATMALEIVAFESVGASALWADWFARIGTLPVAPLSLGALALAAIALWSAWNPWTAKARAD